MVNKEILHEGKYIRVVREGTWEYVEHTSGRHVAYIVPIGENKHGEPTAIFIEEYRIPLKRTVVGFPTGLVGDLKSLSGEEVITAAYRELEEETGYSAGRMRHLVSGPSSSGLSDETIHIYLADKLTKVSDEVGVDGEEIVVREVPLHKAENWLAEREKMEEYVIDIKAYIGLYFANRITLE